MKKCLFIINPSAGQRTIQQKLDAIIGKMILDQIVNSVDIFYTEKKDDGYHKAKDTDEKKYDFFVAVGGDGTINEVISGMVDSHKKIPVVLLAAGTVNDFARYLNLPSEVNAICEMISNFKIIKSDVGKINDQYFINVAAGGMFSDVSFAVSKNDKKRLGPLAYYINGVSNLPSQLRTNIPLQIKIDDEEVINEDAMLFVVTNTKRVGGFEKIIPYADIQDGLLDITVIKKCSVTDLVALSKDYLLKKHIDSPFLIYKHAKKIELSCYDNEVIVDIDGEEGSSLPVTIENVQEAINLIIP
ncbi:MAG: diacylglycerol/lipid kinase family protein [Coprobacillaceae bacterium]